MLLVPQTAAYMTTQHPDYAVLAARIAISNLHKETKKTFSHVIKDLYEYGEFELSALLAHNTASFRVGLNDLAKLGFAFLHAFRRT